MTVEKKNIDWGSLGFAYQHTDYSYVSNYKDGKWDGGQLTPSHSVTLSECAGLLHYCQEVFEGLKAYTTKSGDIVCFRPDMNAQRMYEDVVAANAAWVPPFGSGATLYIRPFMFATGDVIGVKPADEYQFRILVTPVGPYYKGGVKPVKLQVSDYDRAAPHGTGNIKAGLNYAMSLKPSVEAHAKGYADNMFLDPMTRTYVEESGGANILFVKKDGTLVVPQSFTDSILPSITRRSLVDVAQHYLGMTVEQRPVKYQEILDGEFVECGMCGTAAVISPVGEVDDHEHQTVFASGMENVGPVMKKLRETLTGIQSGEIEDKFNWVHKIDVE